jgi:serine/threonine-protein kinase
MTICPSCRAESPNDAMACQRCGCSLVGVFAPGIVLADRYEILAPLGRGGMGIVYHAIDQKLEEPIAIKVLRADYQDSPEITARFRAEIKLARRVSHRNVCRIFEYGDHGLPHYISMELVTGTDLRSLLRERKLSPAEAFDVAIQSTMGLDAIHDVGVIHRDLKSSNIMLDDRNVVRLMDFGIAKQWMGGPSNMTMTGQVIGTPEYMSPEQARGDRIDFRSDLYSLGIVIFEVFTGHVPFHAPTPLATIFMHMHEPPPVEGPAAAGIPDALRPVLLRALAKERTERYASAAELVEGLREARAATLGTADARPTPPPFADTRIARPPAATPAPLFTPSPAPPSGPPPMPTAITGPAIVPPPLRRESPSAVRTDTTPTPIPPVTQTARRSPPPPLRRVPSSEPAAGAGTSFEEPSDNRRTILVLGLATLTVLGTVGYAAWRAASSFTEKSADVTPIASPSTAATVPSPEASGLVGVLGGGSGALAVSPTPMSPSPSPRARPSPSPSARVAGGTTEPITTPSEPPVPPPAATGSFQVVVKPWAEVFVDNRTVGTTPLRKLTLEAGSHTIRLVHPGFKPLQRLVRIKPGETTTLEVDLSWEAVPVGSQ